MFARAKRNDVSVPSPDGPSVRAAYKFENLQDFLDIYYAASNVLQSRPDSCDLTASYFDRAARDNVRHVELFFDSQTHTARGHLPFCCLTAGFQTAPPERAPNSPILGSTMTR